MWSNNNQKPCIIGGKFLQTNSVIYNTDHIETIEKLNDGTTEIIINGKVWTSMHDYNTMIEILKKVRSGKNDK